MTSTPAIDYTNKDFASLRQAMLDLARYRLPEWTDRSPSDLGVLLVDLFAYMGDIILYYQDRIANESFLETATERRSVLYLLRLIGYELQPPVPASADLTLTFTVPPLNASSLVTIAYGTQFTTSTSVSDQQTFEYLGPDLALDLNSAQVVSGQPGKLVYRNLPVSHSLSVSTEVIGSSTGEPNQAFPLSQSLLISTSLIVEVDEGAGWVIWEQRDSLLYYVGPDGRITLSTSDARDYYVQFDENSVAQVIFGDGVYGRIPPVGSNNIRATYRVGGGTVGNVPAGAITGKPTPAIAMLDSVTNLNPAAGGADAESIEHARSFGPLAFRSGQRAVTLEDYVSLAYQAGGVAKVRATSVGWNEIDLYIAPEGETCGPVPEDLRRRIIAFFEDRRMVGTFVQVEDPICVAVDVGVSVVASVHYRADAVRQAVENAVSNLLAFKNVDFGQTLYLSDVYGAVEATPGVSKATVTLFRRHDSPTVSLEQELQKFGTLPDFLLQALNVDAGGRIAIGDFEIPTLGDLSVVVEGGS